MMALVAPTFRQAVKQSARTQAIRSMGIMSKETAEQHKKNNFTSRMEGTGRPVSPHLTVYHFPVAAISSIINRVSGAILSVGCGTLGAIEIFGGSGSALQFMEFMGSQGLVVSSGLKFSLVFLVSHHYLGGIRHLVWDEKPEMLTTEDVTRLSYYMFGICGVASTAAVFM